MLELVRALGVMDWGIALAVLLLDTSLLLPFADAQPQLWAAFCEQLVAQPELYFLQDVVGALASGGGAGNGSSAPQAAAVRALPAAADE